MSHTISKKKFLGPLLAAGLIFGQPGMLNAKKNKDQTNYALKAIKLMLKMTWGSFRLAKDGACYLGKPNKEALELIEKARKVEELTRERLIRIKRNDRLAVGKPKQGENNTNYGDTFTDNALNQWIVEENSEIQAGGGSLAQKTKNRLDALRAALLDHEAANSGSLYGLFENAKKFRFKHMFKFLVKKWLWLIAGIGMCFAYKWLWNIHKANSATSQVAPSPDKPSDESSWILQRSSELPVLSWALKPSLAIGTIGALYSPYIMGLIIAMCGKRTWLACDSEYKDKLKKLDTTLNKAIEDCNAINKQKIKKLNDDGEKEKDDIEWAKKENELREKLGLEKIDNDNEL